MSFQGWWVVRSCPIRHLNDWVAVTLSWIQCCVFFPYFLLAISAPTLSSFFSFSFFFSCLMYVLMAACSICNCNNCLWVSHLHHQILIHPPCWSFREKGKKKKKKKKCTHKCDVTHKSMRGFCLWSLQNMTHTCPSRWVPGFLFSMVLINAKN